MQAKAKKLIIGLTGGIGSGKSVVTDMFVELGVIIADADDISRKLVVPESYALTKIVNYFGAKILHKDGTLNREKLRDIIFADASAKSWLEQLMHPLIRQKQMQVITTAKSPYVLLVSPLLIEAEQAQLCNRVLLIVANERIRLQRIMVRDNLTAKQAQNIMNQQLTDEQRKQYADDIIENNSALDMVQWRVKKLHKMYLDLCSN